MEDKQYPYINFEGITYYKIGCKLCGGGNWAVYSDGQNFIIKCENCDHIIEVDKINLKRKQD